MTKVHAKQYVSPIHDDRSQVNISAMSTARQATVPPNGRRRAEVAGRKEERVVTELMLELEGGHGRVRNVSASGIYFLTDVPLQEGQPLDFKLVFSDLPSGPLEVKCAARVVRIDDQGTTKGIGAAISSFEFRRLS